LTSQVNGQIVKVNFTEGQTVEAGTPLVEIDPRPFEAQLMAAEGQLDRDKALLEEAQLNLERYEAASASNAIPKQQLDDQRAIVHQNQGTVKFDQGQVNNAQVQLGYCHITSPIAGRVGLRLVDPGNVVMASPGTPLVAITQLQPITVIFSVAEDFVPEIQQQLAQGHHMAVEAYDRTQEKRIATGEFLALDNLIDTNTGTIRVRSIFTNENSTLFPNQFVNVRLLIETLHDATLLPAPVIQRNAQAAFVYVVQSGDTNQTVEMRPVKVGVADGNTNAVEGVNPGEAIAADNFNRLQDKAKVSVRKPGENAGQRSGP
jgi:multidrug efflux system membrane fusion protein